jgi:ferredoxin
MMKVRIDGGLCQGHGRCYSLAPEVYDCDDDGYGTERFTEVPGELEEAARRGANNCPEDAITIED